MADHIFAIIIAIEFFAAILLLIGYIQTKNTLAAASPATPMSFSALSASKVFTAGLVVAALPLLAGMAYVGFPMIM